MTRLGRWLRGLFTEDRRERAYGLLRKGSRSYIVIVLLGVVIGLQVAPVVSQFAADPVAGSVAVVTLSGGINGPNAQSVADRLREARQNPDIDAVVIHVNSGGGGAAASETLYLAVKRTAARMPVVVSVDSIAASGAYYAAAPADEVFVKPASLVGSVGVIFVAPQSVPPLDRLLITGPNKLTGADLREWSYKTEAIQNAFVGAVVDGRGDDLELTPEELAYAKLYSGGEAVDNGLADRIGGLEAAVRRAAQLAGLARWDVTTLGYTGPVTFVTRSAYTTATAEQKRLVSPQYFVAAPEQTVAPTIVMLPPSVVRAALVDIDPNASIVTKGVSTNGTVASG
ncbi:MAG: S49 family peptidase [Halobacteriales archaeon]|nr:S49 family peptidase [Halobacteriales archaeon]